MDNIISGELLKKAYTYGSYKQILEEKINNYKPSGSKNERLVEFTKLNFLRMIRIEKTIIIKEEVILKIKSINRKIILLIIAEGWCGDVAQNLPVINAMAELNPNIELKIVFRDENPELMDRFLTDGTRSIPVVILLDKDKPEVLAKWGPRPSPAQDIMVKWKQRKDYDHDKAVKDIQLWYLEDSGNTIQEEFSGIFAKILSR